MNQKYLKAAGRAITQLFLLSQGINPVQSGKALIGKRGERDAVAICYSIPNEKTDIVSSYSFAKEITKLLYEGELFNRFFYSSQLEIKYLIDDSRLIFYLYFYR